MENKIFADAERAKVEGFIKAGKVTKVVASNLKLMLGCVERGSLPQDVYGKALIDILSMPPKAPTPGPEEIMRKLAEELKRPDLAKRFEEAQSILEKLDDEIKALKPKDRGWIKTRALITTRDYAHDEPLTGFKATKGKVDADAPTADAAEPVGAGPKTGPAKKK